VTFVVTAELDVEQKTRCHVDLCSLTGIITHRQDQTQTGTDAYRRIHTHVHAEEDEVIISLV